LNVPKATAEMCTIEEEPRDEESALLSQSTNFYQTQDSQASALYVT